MTSDVTAAWTGSLDELEREVVRSERLLVDDHLIREHSSTGRWQPPANIGPMPSDLRPRADSILARQTAIAETIGQALLNNRHEAVLLQRVDEQRRPILGPVYVDCAL